MHESSLREGEEERGVSQQDSSGGNIQHAASKTSIRLLKSSFSMGGLKKSSNKRIMQSKTPTAPAKLTNEPSASFKKTSLGRNNVADSRHSKSLKATVPLVPSLKSSQANL